MGVPRVKIMLWYFVDEEGGYGAKLGELLCGEKGVPFTRAHFDQHPVLCALPCQIWNDTGSTRID